MPEAFVSCQDGVNIDLDVLMNNCHPQIELIAIVGFEMVFNLQLLLTSGQ